MYEESSGNLASHLGCSAPVLILLAAPVARQFEGQFCAGPQFLTWVVAPVQEDSFVRFVVPLDVPLRVNIDEEVLVAYVPHRAREFCLTQSKLSYQLEANTLIESG